MKSGIGLDVSKNHTGVVIWNGIDTEEYGFAIEEYDKSDYHSEFKMRLDFKNKLRDIVESRHFEYCIIEDVYGGENFDTVRKLIALNTVIDELIAENVCSVNNFIRWSEPTWLSGLRLLHKGKVKLKAKYETQEILEVLEYKFYLEHKDLKDSEKKKIFFEDICDACGMLLSVVATKSLGTKSIKKIEKITLKDIKYVFLESELDNIRNRDKHIKNEVCTKVEFSSNNIENELIKYATNFPDDVMYVELNVNKLGLFGMKHNLKFYESGVGYLFFYNKKAFKRREQNIEV